MATKERPEKSDKPWLARVVDLAPRAALPAELVVALIISLLFALSFGFNFGIDNQVVYMLGSLKLLHPELYKNDWFVAHTTVYHPAYEYLVALLLAISKSGWAVAIAQTVFITTLGMCVYWLMCLIAGRRYALASFALVIAVSFITRMHGVGVSYVIDYIMQPSSIGSLGFVAAIPAFLSGRWILSGVLLAVGGLFHASYLVLGIGVFGLAQLMLGRDDLLKRLLRQLGFCIPVVLFFLPTILKTAGSPLAEPARHILFDVRSPHHFRPSRYEEHFIPFIGWQLLGVGAGVGLGLLRDLPGRVSRLGAIAAALMIVVWSGTVASTSLHMDAISELFVQRLAPHTELVMQAMACLAAVRVVADPRSARRFSKISIAMIVGGLGILLMYEGNRRQHALPNLIYGVLWAVAGVLVLHQIAQQVLRWRPELGRWHWWSNRVGIGVAVIAACAPVEIFANKYLSDGHLKARSTLLRGLNPQETALYAWLRKHTPVDAVLLTPPGVDGMRFHSERAIVVDWKAVPIVPKEIIQWHQRLRDVTGRPMLSGRGLWGYNTLNQRRLDMLKKKYGVDYVVTFRGRQGDLRGKVVYFNSRFVVLDVRSPAAS